MILCIGGHVQSVAYRISNRPRDGERLILCSMEYALCSETCLNVGIPGTFVYYTILNQPCTIIISKNTLVLSIIVLLKFHDFLFLLSILNDKYL